MRRCGLTAREQDALDRMARWTVMLRAGASLVTDEGREQWWGQCQRCKLPDWLSWCHIFTRGAWAVRWDPLNAWAWCRGCHRHMDQHWEQKRDWTIERIGEEEFDAMKLRSNGTKVDYAATRLCLQRGLEATLGRAWT